MKSGMEKMFSNTWLLLLLSHFSCAQLCVTPYMVAHQAPLSMGFSRQEYWSQLPFPSPKHIANNRLIFKVYKEHI